MNMEHDRNNQVETHIKFVLLAEYTVLFPYTFNNDDLSLRQFEKK